MATNLTEIDHELRIIERAVQALRNKVDYLMQSQQIEPSDQPQKLVDLKGIWRHVDLGFEDIQANEYKVPVW